MEKEYEALKCLECGSTKTKWWATTYDPKSGNEIVEFRCISGHSWTVNKPMKKSDESSGLGYPFDGSRNPNTVIEVVKQARKFMPPTAPVSCPICGLLMKCSSYSGDKITFTFICPNDHAWGMTLLRKKED